MYISLCVRIGDRLLIPTFISSSAYASYGFSFKSNKDWLDDDISEEYGSLFKSNKKWLDDDIFGEFGLMFTSKTKPSLVSVFKSDN